MSAVQLPIDGIEGHGKWAATYDRDPNPMLALDLRVTGALLGDMAGARFADIGTGTGRWLAEARRRGAAEVVGIDLCREMLVQAARKAAGRGRLAQAALECLPLADGWADVTLCAFSLGYIADLRRAMAELARITRGGGRVAAVDVHPEGLRRGWTRSFRAEGRVYELRNHAHSEAGWRSAAREAGLTLEQWAEPHFDEPERAIFRRAGKEELFAPAREQPALLIAIWSRD